MRGSAGRYKGTGASPPWDEIEAVYVLYPDRTARWAGPAAAGIVLVVWLGGAGMGGLFIVVGLLLEGTPGTGLGPWAWTGCWLILGGLLAARTLPRLLTTREEIRATSAGVERVRFYGSRFRVARLDWADIRGVGLSNRHVVRARLARGSWPLAGLGTCGQRSALVAALQARIERATGTSPPVPLPRGWSVERVPVPTDDVALLIGPAPLTWWREVGRSGPVPAVLTVLLLLWLGRGPWATSLLSTVIMAVVAVSQAVAVIGWVRTRVRGGPAFLLAAGRLSTVRASRSPDRRLDATRWWGNAEPVDRLELTASKHWYFLRAICAGTGARTTLLRESSSEAGVARDLAVWLSAHSRTPADDRTGIGGGSPGPDDGPAPGYGTGRSGSRFVTILGHAATRRASRGIVTNWGASAVGGRPVNESPGREPSGGGAVR